MKLSNDGLTLIKKFEGLRLSAYQDDAGVWTIGYGSTLYANGKQVKKGDKLESIAEADTLFLITLQKYINAVLNGAKVGLTQNQFNALVSITYNVGTGIMQKSTLIAKLNAGDYAGAADQFLVWNKITDPKTGKKVVSPGLSKRRAQERALFIL